ncbi:MAG: LysE family translocator [Planktomarina sp.]
MSVSILSFAAFAISQVGTPGPANMALLATGARYGLRRVLPFVAGVALGKQLIIWPLGLGLMQLAQSTPSVFLAMKYLSAAYIIFLAWRVASMRLKSGQDAGPAPGFMAGLIVHPLNPKAWGMITVGFTSFVPDGTPMVQATFWIAIILLGVQLFLHPLWAGAGQLIAHTIQGTQAERGLFVTLAILTVASVIYALFGGSS